jgi:hypothetical protein
MKIIELSSSEYKNLVKKPFSIFDSVEFCLLNADKADEIKYLIFNDGKNRFGMIFGIKDGSLRAPFSAPYACLSEISANNKISSYAAIASSLIDYARRVSVEKIRITLPPTIYDQSHLAKIINSFYVAGYSMSGCDLNYQIELDIIGENYFSLLDIKARQKLRSALDEGLIFEETENIQLAYDIIRRNRESKNYPLWMSYENVLATGTVVEINFFIAYDRLRAPIASAMVYRVSGDKAQIIYWGNSPDTENLRPMNFMAYSIFNHYKGKGVKFMDIGPSTEFSIPNVGLCDFKQSIGCTVSPKISFEIDISG